MGRRKSASVSSSGSIVARRDVQIAFHGGGGNRTRVRGRTDRTSTSVVRASISPGGRFADDLPTGQPSFGVVPQAIGAPSVPSPIVGAPLPASGRTGWDVALPSFD